MTTNPFDNIFDKIEAPAEPEPAVVFPELPDPHPAPPVSLSALLPSVESVVESVTVYKGDKKVILSEKQKTTLMAVARQRYLETEQIEAPDIREHWPTLENVDKSDLQERIKLIKAGGRPSLAVIANYIVTEEFVERMAGIGVNLTPGLTARQIALLDSFSDLSDKMSLRSRLTKLGIQAIEFQAWLKHPPFAKAYKKYAEGAMFDALPLAKVALAKRMEQGDLAAIKFGMEVTGEYNPNDKKQVDAAKLVQVIFDVIEEEIKDPELLRRIGNKITLRGNTARGELSQ